MNLMRISANRNSLTTRFPFARRSRSRDRRENSDDRIDKKRLLEIARKNAITMLKNGTLPGTQNLGADAKEKALAKMRFGGKSPILSKVTSSPSAGTRNVVRFTIFVGKSVDELTEFCKRLSKGESSGYLSNVSNESEDEADIDKAFHHPFVLKDRGPIVMNIRVRTQSHSRPVSVSQSK